MCGVFCGQPDRKAECLGQTEQEFYIILKGEPPVTILLTIYTPQAKGSMVCPNSNTSWRPSIPTHKPTREISDSSPNYLKRFFDIICLSGPAVCPAHLPYWDSH